MSLVTRREVWLRRRRRKQVLTALALVLGLFPPMWALYFVAWLVWRSRPKQQSMRRVRKAVRALEKNQTGPALKQLQEAHLLSPSNNDALYWLGLLLSAQHRYEEAEEALSLVAERVPGLPEVETALVKAYVTINEPESAVYHAQRLLDVAPYEPETLLTLSDAFEAAGRIDLAIQSLEQAPLHKRTLTDELVKIHYRLGMLYERRGDAAEALDHFKRVYARDITYRDVLARVAALEAGEEK
jgi:tetratricopeptide (TPR) repeat protein